MKRLITAFCVLLIIFSTTITIATNGSAKIKKGDEFLKDSLSKWEDVGERSAIDVMGEFFQKGFPTLSRADANRLIINFLIFSCIANVGIVIYIMKKDKEKKDTILDSSANSFHQTDRKRSKQILSNINLKHPEFQENTFLKEVKSALEKHFEQMQNEINDGIEHHIERVKISDIEVVKYFTDENKEKIVVVLRVRMIEYWIDTKTKIVIKGNNKSLTQSLYKATLQLGSQFFEKTSNNNEAIIENIIKIS